MPEKPWMIEASVTVSAWSLEPSMGNALRDALTEEANKLGLDCEDYDWDKVEITVQAFRRGE